MGYITEKERYQIEVLLKKRVPVREIAQLLGRSRAAIYREISRGTVVLFDSGKVKDVPVYCADVGQRKQDEASGSKGMDPVYLDPVFLKLVSKLLNQKYSPEAMLPILRASGFTVSFKTIYNYIHKGLIPRFSSADLLYPRKKRNPAYSGRRIARNHPDHRSIEDRPRSVLSREEFGHWELDSVESGKGDNTTLLAFTERKTRLELLFKVSGKTSSNTVRILNRLERRLTSPVFRQVFKTITVDNGCEFLDASGMERSCYNKVLRRTTVYYCHPYCSSERGSNENHNRFIRRFIPKGDFISLYSDADIRHIQDFINAYPRKMFGFRSSLDYAMSL